ncbi:MAG TPA: sigma-70 family RNA polymerase sigma factor [Candidatus Polarisedimenticolaceae bacterium]|nr:sigma-70 family RNA polymerase sigma factor [Candidatus Polarisedimenticolaceae bacterium]
MKTAEEALLAALRRGDPRAYETLVRTSAPQLLAVCRRILRDEEDARDAVQEAFVNAWKGLPRFAEGSRLSTWLHRIAVNAALMKLRSRRRHPEEPIEDLLPTFVEDGHQARPSEPWVEPAELALDREQLQALVRQAIDRLPETYRLVLLLREMEGLDTAAAAEVLGVTENAVKLRLHRARQALRTLLDPVMRRGGP